MRLRGVFLAIATLAFAEMVRIFLINQSWTNGAQGLSFPKLVGPEIAWIVLILVAFFFWRLSGSRLGRAFDAIREDELAATAMGINVARYRMLSFVIAGALSGLYGVLLGYFTRFADPNEFSFTAAVDGLVTAVVGGVVLFVGPILGAVFLTVLPELQRLFGIDAGWIRPLISGLLLLVVILFLPGGLAGLIPRRKSASKLVTDAGAAARLPDLPAHGTPLVTLHGLGKSYGGVHAVRSVDLSVAAGEVVGLIGPNGAGKTTLVNIVTALASPSHGTAEVLGTAVTARTKAHVLAQAGVARTFQQIKLFSRLSALENALAAHPSLLVLDEPAAGMNRVEAGRLSELIRTLAADGLGVLVIEHNVRMMLETCDRIVVMNFGEVIASGAPAEITRNPAVLEAYLGAASSGPGEEAAERAVQDLAAAADDASVEHTGADLTHRSEAE